jgi:large subunit ribosomal protein L4
MRRLALYSALSTRAGDGEIRIVDSIDWEAPKTKSAATLLAGMGVEGKVAIVVASSDGVVAQSVRNLPQALVITPGQLNTYDVLWAETIIFTADTIQGVGSGAADASVTEEAGGDS